MTIFNIKNSEQYIEFFKISIKSIGFLLLIICVLIGGFFSYYIWDQNQKINRIYEDANNKIFADKMTEDLQKLAEIVSSHPKIKFYIELDDLVFPREFDELCSMPPYPIIKSEDMKKAFGFEWKHLDNWKDAYIGESWTMLFIEGKDVIPIRLKNNLIHLFPSKSSANFSYQSKYKHLVCYYPKKEKLKLKIYRYQNYIQNIEITK